MAAQNLSPRQKMINLMYLVFIAMLAINMGKEVLSAFGLLNEKLEASNVKATTDNTMALEGLARLAGEKPDRYRPVLEKANQIKETSADYYAYLEELKTEMTENLNDKQDYEKMDQPKFLDKKFFRGGGKYTDEGQEFVDKIDNYRETVMEILGEENFSEIKSSVAGRFSTGENGKAENRDGKKIDWLNYNFEGFPLVASLTKITQMQTDIKTTESEIFGAMLGEELSSEVSMTNYTTLLEQPKSAYYQGEVFDGAVVLGRTDATTKPHEVELYLDGKKLTEDDYSLDGGKVKLNVSSGSPGDHKLEGKLIFMQNEEPIEVPVSSTFATITKPNAAVISADKMNVVYRGVSNPITISIPGIPDNKVSASATGLTRVSGSKYTMRPGSGRTVNISASGTLPDGQRISTTSEFRIKDVPRPSGTIRGESGEVSMPRSSLEKSTVGAILEDFDFDLNLGIRGFKFKVPGQPTVSVSGNRLDGKARSVLKRARRGDAVQIFDIQAYITGNTGYRLKKVSPVVIQLTN
ncbi:gliding motility protein GldM [Sinomicrobium weinanense]|uniref:Gliding motility protein GldM n=1 Tax=Sinomicrobium weinanense TaxID=2842200 RepID=A0A926JRH6_9FLAO|nr:gliding motility protein GldM [Sinomicrobium weinanense]MBC9795906.1 gliding motility protein GldM [Sinomicrobium weinanense]MBU3124715.1 gliding motility protein GldM [Sinomicrobium weinanense]